MQVEIHRFPNGIPLKTFEVNATSCEIFWNQLQLPKLIFIREIDKKIIKPNNYLAFTFIGYDITYQVNQKTKYVEKLKIDEQVIVYLPKWNQLKIKAPKIQKRYYTFLKMALYHEYKYHVYLYEDKQLNFLYKLLENIKNPTLPRVAWTIKKFQKKLIKEQEISHARAPRGQKFCFQSPKDILKHYQPIKHQKNKINQ